MFPSSPRLVILALTVGLASSCSCGPINAGPKGCELTQQALAGAPPAGPVPSTRELFRSEQRDSTNVCADLTAAVEAEKAGRTDDALDGYARFLRDQPAHGLGPIIEARTETLVTAAWAPAATAFTAGDCAPVTATRAKVLARFDDRVTKAVAPQAKTQADQCQALDDAARAEADARHDMALLIYSTLVPLPASPAPAPLAAAARDRARALIERVGAGALASPTNCTGGPTAQLFPPGSETAFDLALACATWAEGSNSGAASRYERLLAEYPGHPRTGDIRAGLARAMLAGGQGGGDLPPPQVAGRNAGGPRITVRNSTNKRLRLVLGGPTTLVEELPPCAGCSASFIAGTCDSRATASTYSLPAGSYKAAVRVIDGTATPYAGTWSISAGTTYEHCLYIQTTFR